MATRVILSHSRNSLNYFFGSALLSLCKIAKPSKRHTYDISTCYTSENDTIITILWGDGS